MKYYSGEVEEINEKEEYITVDGIEIGASRDFVEKFFLEVGDEVKIGTEITDDGLKAITCMYIDDDIEEDEDDDDEYLDIDSEEDLKKFYR